MSILAGEISQHKRHERSTDMMNCLEWLDSKMIVKKKKIEFLIEKLRKNGKMEKFS